MSHVCVVVLGDTGRSPRMQYHAHSLAQQTEVDRISLIGYVGEPCISSVATHTKINDIRLNVTELNFLRRIPLLHALCKGVCLVLKLVWALISISAYDVILIQTPPALPGMYMCVRKCSFLSRQQYIGLDLSRNKGQFHRVRCCIVDVNSHLCWLVVLLS
jgi:beta-1,4-mannosyltransferase